MLDERLLGGEMQETSKKNVLKAVTTQDMLQEESEKNRGTVDELMQVQGN
jgi:AP-1 complex subunit sigma 1/2